MKIRNKIVGGILAVAVIGTCAYAACGTNSTPTNEQLVLQPFIPEKDNQNSSVESESQACIGMSLTVSEILYEDYVEYNVSSEAIKAYTLTARYAPSYVTMSAQVDWSVSFVNPASEWAVGKTATDYITVTPETDGALTATVECWEGFSSDILITATLRANNAVKANCLCVWIHNNDEGGENEGGGNSGSSGDDGTGDSSSGSGSSGTQNPDSGNTDSGNTDSGNTGAIGSTDNRNDELFEGNYADGQWGDKVVSLPVYNGIIICVDDTYGDEFSDDTNRYFKIPGVKNFSLEHDFMVASKGATWAEWLANNGGTIGITQEGYAVTAYIEDGNVYIEIADTELRKVSVYQIIGVNENHEIGWNAYQIEYVTEYWMSPTPNS